MAVACPASTRLASPTGCTTSGINEMKLALITVRVIGEQAAQDLIGIRTLFKPFQPTDAEIRIGVCLRSHSTNPRTNVRDGGSHRQMASCHGDPKPAVAWISRNDRKGHVRALSSR